MSNNTESRYYVFSKNSPTKKALKNLPTREMARRYKRTLPNPSIYAIFDRYIMQTIS